MSEPSPVLCIALCVRCGEFVFGDEHVLVPAMALAGWTTILQNGVEILVCPLCMAEAEAIVRRRHVA